MHYLISGGTGFIGKPLVAALCGDGHEVSVLTRDYAAARKRLGPDVSLLRSLDGIPADQQIDVIVNLAGAGIADRRWSARRKRELLDSRVHTTHELVELVQRLRTRPRCFLSASAVGYYGASDDTPLTETDTAVTREFTHELCRRWEEEALRVSALDVRTVITRFGVVLGSGGGMLARLEWPFRLALGGRLGSGHQMLTWVHRDDVISAIRFLIDDERHDGVFNVTAPQPVTNAAFTRALARAVGRPAIMHMPSAAVRLLFGEMGDRLLLNGQCVMPARLQESGFEFSYPEVDAALQQAMGRGA